MNINPKIFNNNSDTENLNNDCLEILINKNTEINIYDIDLRICQLNA
jgi:hypothetical protein